MEAELHPRPQLRRDDWISLDGPWEFAIDREACWDDPQHVIWDAEIVVPYAPETAASGIGDTSFYKACWYRRTFEAPPLEDGRLILHFGAVDYAATVWLNGQVVATHEGGYTPFEADITRDLVDGPQTLIVCAFDDPHDLAKPRGKQDWLLNPHSIWYSRTTGIWQTVWLERVGSLSIAKLRWTSNLDRWEIGLEATLSGDVREHSRIHARMWIGERVLADDIYAVVHGEVTRRIALSDPGIDDFRNEILWSPAHPVLIEAELELLDDDAQVIDTVRSYTALRSIGIERDRFLLNGRPYRLRLVLDQGYWPDTGLTPPSVDALRQDVALAKEMGFNGVRKHQKIEDPRYLYWADKLGLMVWEEMPSSYRFTRSSVERTLNEWLRVIDRDCSHPCIVTWVPFNESWGVPDLPSISAQRHYVAAVYQITKTIDPERPVIGNDGWESSATDFIGIHDYDDDPVRLADRYRTQEAIPALLERERPEGHLILLDGEPHTSQPIVLTEFGGIAYAEDDANAWGYQLAHSSDELRSRYERLMAEVHALPLLAGFCYTQFADTYQESNGLLFADRTPKFPIDQMRRMTTGPERYRDNYIEREWRERAQQADKAPRAPRRPK